MQAPGQIPDSGCIVQPAWPGSVSAYKDWARAPKHTAEAQTQVNHMKAFSMSLSAWP